MLRMPRSVETKARSVGTQDWKAEERLTRYRLVGVQCSGRLEEVMRTEESNVVVAIERRWLRAVAEQSGHVNFSQYQCRYFTLDNPSTTVLVSSEDISDIPSCNGYTAVEYGNLVMQDAS